MIRTAPLLGALVCVGTILAACSSGGGPSGPSGSSGPPTAPSSSAPPLVASITPELASALAGAGRALTAVTSYDYRHLQASHDDAVRYLAEPFRSQYETSWPTVAAQAPASHAVVTGKITNAGISAVKGDQIEVLAYGQQTVSNKDTSTARVELTALHATLARTGSDWALSRLDAVSTRSPAAPASTTWAAPDLATALIAARQCITAITGPDRAHFEVKFQAALTCTSGELNTSLRAREAELRQAVAKITSLTMVITGMGVSSATADQVRVLVSVTTSSTPSSGSARQTSHPFLATMRHVSGQWLLTDLETATAH